MILKNIPPYSRRFVVRVIYLLSYRHSLMRKMLICSCFQYVLVEFFLGNFFNNNHFKERREDLVASYGVDAILDEGKYNLDRTYLTVLPGCQLIAAGYLHLSIISFCYHLREGITGVK